jgi:hypothetical protein
VPRGLSDSLAIAVLLILGLESLVSTLSFASVPLGVWILMVAAPLVCILASLSDTTTKVKEELAILVYGGSVWQVWLRYVLRGLACTVVATLPYFYFEYALAKSPFLLLIAGAISIAAAGGAFYAAISVRRLRSREFVENFKG